MHARRGRKEENLLKIGRNVASRSRAEGESVCVLAFLKAEGKIRGEREREITALQESRDQCTRSLAKLDALSAEKVDKH